MDLEPFKNKDGSIYKKEKIRFIQARIKLVIYNKMKRVRALLWITIYADFERAVLNAKNAVRNQNSFGRKPGGHQKRGHSGSNAGQAQPLKKPFLKRNLEGLKPRTPSSGKESQGQSGTRLTPLQEYSEKSKENSKGKPHQKNRQGNSRTNNLKKEKPQLRTFFSYNQGKIQKGRLFILLSSWK